MVSPVQVCIFSEAAESVRLSKAHARYVLYRRLVFTLIGKYLRSRMPLFCITAPGRDKNAYYHEYFLRGRPLLAQKITRTKVKGKGARKASSPETEPQLYDFPWMKVPEKPSAPSSTGEQQNAAAAGSHRISPTLTALAGLAPVPSPTVATSAFSVPRAHAPRSLGDALGFLSTLNQVQAASPPSRVSVLQQGGETMFLPTTSSSNNSAALNTLLSSFSTRTDPAQSSAASRYIPIAPAPPAQGGEPIKPRLETGTSYASVLAALKAQHQMPGQITMYPFTTPGPAPF